MFKRSLKTSKPAIIGLICQFLLLPVITFVLVSIVKPTPSIALGLFLVAACPGGNLSNFLTHLAKGNTALRNPICIKTTQVKPIWGRISRFFTVSSSIKQ